MSVVSLLLILLSLPQILSLHHHGIFGSSDGLELLHKYVDLYPSSPMYFVSKACLKDKGSYAVAQHSSIPSRMTAIFVFSEESALEHCFWVNPTYSKHYSLHSLIDWHSETIRPLKAGEQLSLNDRHLFRKVY